MSINNTVEIPCGAYSVAADVYAGASNTDILLNLVGWASDRKRYNNMLSNITQETGMSAVTFDYSGTGDSRFKIDQTRPAQHFLEVICVFDWIVNTYPDATVHVMGTSYGGFLATQLTKHRTFDSLVLRVPAMYRPQDFYSLAPDVHSTKATKAFRFDADALARHPLLLRASGFEGRTLVIVHDEDEFVPHQTTDAYIQAFSADVHTVHATHAPRNQSPDWLREYNGYIANWLKNNKRVL